MDKTHCITMLELFSSGFRITALFLVLVFTIIVLLFENKSFIKIILLFFLVTTIAYLLAYWEVIPRDSLLFQFVFPLSVIFPLSLWLVRKALFDNEFVWNSRYLLYIISITLIHNLLYAFNEHFESTYYKHFRFIPYYISVIFIILVIFESLRNKENVLILSRFKKRNEFVIFSSILALVSVYYFFIEDPFRLPVYFTLAQNIFICIFVILFFSDHFEFKALFPSTPASNNKSQIRRESLIQKRIIEKLYTVFRNEKLFITEGIIISQLGEIINEKEYLIRRAINKELGYTNFNSFLNHYRINEARRMTNENQLKELTFQEIAYRLGYQSVATFNRAFKNETGQTPSDYASTAK